MKNFNWKKILNWKQEIWLLVIEPDKKLVYDI